MAAAPVRGTQSFVATLSSTWRRPSLVLLEVLWRWVYGMPALLLLWHVGRDVVGAATGGSFDPATLGLDRALLNDPVGALTADPMAAAGKFAVALGAVLPGLERAAVWVLPLLLVGWAVVSGVGRTLVLRRADPALHARPATLAALAALRTLVLGAVFAVWFGLLRVFSAGLVVGPIARHQEPSLVLYAAALIVTSLGLFTAWGFVSWALSVAPLAAMIDNVGVLQSLRRAATLGPLRSRLVETNLVLGIVKIALVVLAMVFSATPLPFQTVASQGFLAVWWAGVTLLYLLWSDFFHVARLVGYLALWRMEPPPPASQVTRQ